MTILVLMAGPSDSFRDAGYLFPKPLIEIAGKPLVQYVIEHLSSLVGEADRMIVMVRQDENAKYHIGAVVKLLASTVEVLEVRGETAGAACTALLGVDAISDEEPLIIVNGDQLIEADLASVVHQFQARSLDGGIVVFQDVHPRWSFVKCGEDGLVIEAAEKRPISNLATAGFYYFKSGREFVEAAQAMILKNAAVNGLFYVCPAYNELILRNCKIGTHQIEKSQYVSFATPQGVELFERRLNDERTTK
jgi:dTDP-glucose pyrophosphorylase